MVGTEAANVVVAAQVADLAEVAEGVGGTRGLAEGLLESFESYGLGGSDQGEEQVGGRRAMMVLYNIHEGQSTILFHNMASRPPRKDGKQAGSWGARGVRCRKMTQYEQLG